MLPQLVVVMELPEVLAGRGFARLQNRSARAASEFALRTHKRETTRKHFQRGNRQRYGHKTRRPSTIARKRKETGRAVDLVMTGTSRELAVRQRPSVTHRGSMTRGQRESRYTLRLFAFPVRRSPSRSGGVSIADMVREAAKIDISEYRTIRGNWRDRYGAAFQKGLDASPRLRKRLTST